MPMVMVANDLQLGSEHRWRQRGILTNMLCLMCLIFLQKQEDTSVVELCFCFFDLKRGQALLG